jgi:hypothetical protein
MDMKKLLTLTMLLVLTVGVSAFATNTRVLTLGQNNNVLIDDANIFIYPSRINNYPNLATGEFYSDEFINLGMNWKFGEAKPWVLGTYFSNGPTVYPEDFFGNRFGEFNYTEAGYLPSNRRINLIYGRQLGELNFGFGFDYIHSSYTSKVTNDQEKQKFSKYAFSFGLTPKEGNWDVSAGISIGSWTNKNTNGIDLTKPDGYMDLFAMGRYFYKYNNTMVLIPHAGVAYGKHGQKYISEGPDIDSDIKSTYFGFQAGAGLNYTPVEKVLAVADFGIQYESYKNAWTGVYTRTDEKESYFYVPYWKLGIEGDVFSWLDVRLGAVNNWENFTYTDNYSTSSAYTQTYLGAGFNFNRLHIDVTLDPTWLTHGPYFVSGDYTDHMFEQLSVLYELF